MKLAVAVSGTRGDVEPCAAVALELSHRGHEVRIAVPPDLTTFVESAGLPNAVGYGIPAKEQTDNEVFRDWWKPRNPLQALRDAREFACNGWSDMSSTLDAMAAGADLILTATTYQEVAANVAEKRQIPLAAMHYFPARPNSKITPVKLPAPLVVSGMKAAEWAYWKLIKPAEDEQRRELGLPETTIRSAKRIGDSGALELQAYDPALFPGLDEEWAGARPFVGSITMELGGNADADVADWIAAGTPPIFFGFGSTPIESPGDLISMIEWVCEQLGERALVSSGSADWTDIGHGAATKIVKSANYPTVFPLCRAIVHHGGAGTLAAAIRAGAPSVALWSVADQPIWSSRAELLKVGKARRFSKTNGRTLMSDLRTVLAPEFAERTRALASRMIKPSEGIARAADLIEHAARNGRRPRSRSG